MPELLRFNLRAYRQISITPFRIIYRVFARTVLVLAMLDGRRDLEDIILARRLSMH